MFCLKLFMVVLLLAFSMKKAESCLCTNISPDEKFSVLDSVVIIKVVGVQEYNDGQIYFVNEVEILKANGLRKGYNTIINQLKFSISNSCGSENFKINERYIVSIDELIDYQGGPEKWYFTRCGVILRANDVSETKWNEFVNHFREQSKKNAVFNNAFNQGYVRGSNIAYDNGYKQGLIYGYNEAYESIKRTYNLVNFNDYNRYNNRYNNWHHNGYYYGIKVD